MYLQKMYTLKRSMNGREIEFDCDEANVAHVGRHSVLPDEAEQVMLGVLLVVTTWREDRIRVVTAFKPIKRLITFYHQERER